MPSQAWRVCHGPRPGGDQTRAQAQSEEIQKEESKANKKSQKEERTEQEKED